MNNVGGEFAQQQVQQTVRSYLDKIYYQLRNLGQSSPDRALNYAATNAFSFAEAVAQGMMSSTNLPGGQSIYTLDTISVSKSPYCRIDSDCWDVQVTFFDPENDRRARSVYLYTIDVSDDVKNTGTRDGVEVVQLFVRMHPVRAAITWKVNDDEIFRPPLAADSESARFPRLSGPPGAPASGRPPSRAVRGRG